MSNFPSSASGSSEVSSPQYDNQRGSRRPDRGKKKKNPSEQDYDSPADDDEGSYDASNNTHLLVLAGKAKGKSSVALGIQNKGISKKSDLKLKNKVNTQTSSASATFLYKPGVELPNLRPYLNQIIEIRISSEYIDKSNQALIMRQIWGSNGVYASHSDAVCMGVHTGLLGLNDIKAKSQLYQGVALLCKVIKGKKSLNHGLKAPLLSRSLKVSCAHCLKPERQVWLSSLGTPDQLIQWASRMSIPPNRRLTKRNHLQVYCHEQPVGLNPESVLLRNLPPFNQGWIIWDMCNEPSQKYNLITFMDKQSNYDQNTAYKLRSHCLYIENETQKFEISMDSRFFEEDVFLNQNIFMINEVMEPHRVDMQMMQRMGVPLPQQIKKPIGQQLKWSDFDWGNDNVAIKGVSVIGGLKCFKMIMHSKHHM